MNFRLGINYWPISSAMRMWQRFDAGEIERDFALIRSAGFDSVRVFLLWEDFQPQADIVSGEAIAKLVQVVDIAGGTGLQLMPTLFTGHMSGANWIPPWALENKEDPASRFRVVSNGRISQCLLKNWYADIQILNAQILLAREVAAALVNHSALWAYDLGNENSNCVVPLTKESARNWLRQITDAIRSVDDAHPITIGLHMEDLEEDRKLGPEEAAEVCDFLCMHGYPLYADWADGPTDALLPAFLGSITRWLGGKEVLFQEYGAPAVPHENLKESSGSPFQLLDEKTAADYTAKVTSYLHELGFMGGMLWCFGDYSKSIWHEAPLDKSIHERFFGLWHDDHSPKPVLVQLKALSERQRHKFTDDLTWIDVEKNEFYLSPSDNVKHLYRQFRAFRSDDFLQG
jgi:endo-1,4-beta-mannosidase